MTPSDTSDKIVPQGYMCTKEDLVMIQGVEKITDPEEVLVYFKECGSRINRKLLSYLFHKTGKNGYVEDEIINAYIGHLYTKKHLRDGFVVLENTYTTRLLSRDGDRFANMDDLNDMTENNVRTAAGNRAALYLSTDMVFLPVNIKNGHWYLVVINAKKHKVQILDSLGSPPNREELELILEGLSNQIKLAAKHFQLDTQNWQDDLDVAHWPREEVELGESIQRDRMQEYLCLIPIHSLNGVKNTHTKDGAKNWMLFFRFTKEPCFFIFGVDLQDYWLWDTPVMDDGWEERNRPASRYHVLSTIDGWNGEDRTVETKDALALRREFLVTILTSSLNETFYQLPEDVKNLLSQIVGK